MEYKYGFPFTTTPEDIERDSVFCTLTLQHYVSANFDIFPFELIASIIHDYLNHQTKELIQSITFYGNNVATISYVVDQEDG
jgi:hypothetical protein